jgi:hypothetical protein
MKKFQTLGVKEWFSDKEGLPSDTIDSVIEVKEKAIKVSMTSLGKTTFHWIPKSCLCFVEAYNSQCYANCDGLTIEEAIEGMRLKISVEELVRLNEEQFNDYC